MKALEERLMGALREVQDPEMPISLVDLGLIYGVQVEGSRARIDLTFTAMGCPASDFIVSDIRERLLQEPGIDQVEIRVVWDPPWTAERLSPEGRDTLVAWGLAV